MNLSRASYLAHPLLALVLGTVCSVTTTLAQTAPAAKPAAAAQEESIILSVFEVTTAKDIGYQSSNAAEATRMNTPIEDIPMNVTIYNQQMIEDLLATDTSELLAFEASSVKRTENDGFLSRGFSQVGSSFVNGFAQTTGFGAQPLANIERVEVLQGPAAVLFGSGGFGATYNRITKQARANAFTNFRTILSDDHSYRAELDYNAGYIPAFGKKLLFRFNTVRDRSTTWFGQRKAEDVFAPTVTWNISRNTKAVFDYIYNWQDRQASWETPIHAGDPKGLVTGDGVYRETPRNIHWGIPEDYRRNTRQSLSTDIRHSFSDNFQFRAQAQYEVRLQAQEETVANGTFLSILRDTALIGRYWRQIPRTTRSYRTRDEFIWNFKTGSIVHRMLFGFGWQQQYDRNTTYQSASSGNNNTYANVSYAQFLANPALAGYTPGTGVNPLLLPVNMFDRGVEPPTPGIAKRPVAALNADAQSYTSNQDYYINDVFSFAQDRVFVVAGLRHTDFQRKIITWNSGATLRPSAPTVYTLADATTSSVGATWHLTSAKTLSLYANMNTSFAPIYNVQPDGSPLDSEVGLQKEVGIRFNLLSSRIQGLVSYFDILQDNVTSADPLRPGYFIQRSGQRATGFEGKLNARMTDGWAITGSFADIDARNDITGVATDLQPQYKVSVINTYNFSKGSLKGLRLTLAQRFTGERPLTNSTSRGEPNWGPMPAYWNHDFVVGYKLRAAKSRYTWDLLFKLSNVLNNTDQYYVGAWHRYTLDPGRQWQATASVRF
ncbi:MAG: TonB-dependent receptor plug domain-containing protein [Opitutae bacterium]|nr:TonB-dependent receptor plug domain-containing protein [Opitutae bacterium]